MQNKALKYLCLGLVAGVVGCQAPGLKPLVPTGGVAPIRADGQQVQSEVAVTIQWPYRAQVLPTSAQHLTFQLSGPTSETISVFRPEGSSPTSVATLSVDVGNGYTLNVQAYDNALRLVASGTSAAFNVLANERTNVTVALLPVYAPSITGFSPDNGGPGATVEIYGTNFVLNSGLKPSFTFGGVPATVVYEPLEGTVSVLVPMTAVSGIILPRLDGVTGTGTGSFTVLKDLAISPVSVSLASGSSQIFTALATTSGNVAFTATPSVTWRVSAPFTSLPINQYRIQINGDGLPEGSTESISVGTIDQQGTFTAKATGSTEISIMSGTLLATASVTVTE